MITIKKGLDLPISGAPEQVIQNGPSITEVAILVAAKYFASPIFPISPVSTIPTKGIARFEKKTGIERRNICFLEIFTGYLIVFIFILLNC